MKIAVILADGTFAVVGADELNALLKNQGIRSFLRSDGWVRIGYDLLRESGSGNKYEGDDRRNKSGLYKLRCDYCGREFHAVDTDSSYSVVIEDDGLSIKIVEDEWVFGAYHYCSCPCLCRRKNGTLSIEQLNALEEQM